MHAVSVAAAGGQSGASHTEIPLRQTTGQVRFSALFVRGRVTGTWTSPGLQLAVRRVANSYAECAVHGGLIFHGEVYAMKDGGAQATRSENSNLCFARRLTKPWIGWPRRPAARELWCRFPNHSAMPSAPVWRLPRSRCRPTERRKLKPGVDDRHACRVPLRTSPRHQSSRHRSATHPT